MKSEFIEVGQIVNTHGIRGELKVQPWCDSAEQLCEFATLYLDGKAIAPSAVRVHKGNVLMTLPQVDSIEAALPYKTKILTVRRADVKLPEGRYFNADLIGLDVIDDATGVSIGAIADVLEYPANNVLVVRGEKEYLIPAVPAVIMQTDLDGGTMTIHLLKGMATDEN